MHEEYDGPDGMDDIDMKLAAIEHREGAESRHEMIAAMTEDNPVIAKAFYSAYSSLLDAGFEEDQAMEIVIRRGWHLAEGC